MLKGETKRRSRRIMGSNDVLDFSVTNNSPTHASDKNFISAPPPPPSSSRSCATISTPKFLQPSSGVSAFLFLLLIPLLLLVRPAAAGPAEDRLIATVLKGYNPLARPVGGDQAVDVWFGMGLIQILQIIEVEQTVKANVWLRLVW